ncbi:MULTISPECIES: PLP-dependent aminotransferase family protein [unclassified Serratia (in: enterobacteria)]|uniref:MocR-like pyridoxine biosynthesis transcription factor PdxR n=1 Tax=unclassified Serratia (in: enterobacteria) TaxID=2647522 RepID=UPI00050599A2|nr:MULTISPECIES: PLP-dependent aminotransferase family protein [unclassified Serratia (in: enterobacteria)]KFK92308.1 DNA-binding protein [Serratia sp. Ag2]KFK96056.1 DNA-binding protein [Serratia sp. Ag1]
MRHILASLRLDNQLAEPLYRQIYLRIKDAITQGTLVANARLPSVRGLASDLGVARATVENAYAALVAEGFLQSRGQAGTYVSAQLLDLTGRSTLAAIEPLPVIAPPAFRPERQIPPFQLGLPALDVFPRTVWQRIVARQLRSTTTAAMAHPPASGLPELRTAIAHYLHLSRGIVCQPEQVFICAGYQALLDLIISTLLRPGDAVWLEDPGYPITQPLLKIAGMQTIPIPVDDEGMDIAAGIALRPDARLAVLTPTHQSPLGISLSLARRMALLEWAQQQSAWIVEDDYDSEFRYHGRPLPPLKSLDRQGRVLYAGTFSKTLFPALRLAYLVVPACQVAAFEACSYLRMCGCPPLMQAAVADFINDGHFYRHLKRMRPLYRQRREWLAQALGQRLANELTVVAQAGGIQLLAQLKAGLNDHELAQQAWQQGLAVQALSNWQIATTSANGLLMGFTNFSQYADVERVVARLAEVIGRGN